MLEATSKQHYNGVLEVKILVGVYESKRRWFKRAYSGLSSEAWATRPRVCAVNKSEAIFM